MLILYKCLLWASFHTLMCVYLHIMLYILYVIYNYIYNLYNSWTVETEIISTVQMRKRGSQKLKLSYTTSHS